MVYAFLKLSFIVAFIILSFSTLCGNSLHLKSLNITNTGKLYSLVHFDLICTVMSDLHSSFEHIPFTYGQISWFKQTAFLKVLPSPSLPEASKIINR